MSFMSANFLSRNYGYSSETSDDYEGEIHSCDYGDLAWIPVDQVKDLNLWEGDRIFLEFV